MTDQQRTLKTPTQRWRDGDGHHPESRRLFDFLRDYDWKVGPTFDWRYGGDGDNGEELMYHLDAWFETEEEAADEAAADEAPPINAVQIEGGMWESDD